MSCLFQNFASKDVYIAGPLQVFNCIPLFRKWISLLWAPLNVDHNVALSYHTLIAIPNGAARQQHALMSWGHFCRVSTRPSFLLTHSVGKKETILAQLSSVQSCLLPQSLLSAVLEATCLCCCNSTGMMDDFKLANQREIVRYGGVILGTTTSSFPQGDGNSREFYFFFILMMRFLIRPDRIYYRYLQRVQKMYIFKKKKKKRRSCIKIKIIQFNF